MSNKLNIVPRSALTADHPDLFKNESHHDHLIYLDESGRLRWVPDPFTHALFDVVNLNNVICDFHGNGVTKNHELYRELYRKMGYSIDGYWEVFYWEMNNPDVADYKQPT